MDPTHNCGKGEALSLLGLDALLPATSRPACARLLTVQEVLEVLRGAALLLLSPVVCRAIRPSSDSWGGRTTHKNSLSSRGRREICLLSQVS